METFSQKTVILGAGLLGGSLGMAMRQRGLAGRIHVWSPSEGTRSACLAEKWCDKVHPDPKDACLGADLIFLCGPVDRIPALMEEIAPFCAEGCLITDVGSTKANICEAGARIFPRSHPATFIGSHPMAGSEKSGMAHATADLFDGKTCILTPLEKESVALDRLRTLWERLGMKRFECTPEEHDRIVAHVSHLPHALAAALCQSLSQLPEEWAHCAGAGLRDTTRIAAGDPALWTAIFRENESAFRQSLAHLQRSLDELSAALDEPEDDALIHYLSTAQEYRERLDPPAR
tara:strand:+ start:142 stop:1011 length:870 start_codon:yes stop_codon:yes gene_type:complete